MSELTVSLEVFFLKQAKWFCYLCKKNLLCCPFILFSGDKDEKEGKKKGRREASSCPFTETGKMFLDVLKPYGYPDC